MPAGWVAPAVLCAVFYALSGAWQKGWLPTARERVIVFAMFAGGLPVFAVLWAASGASLAGFDTAPFLRALAGGCAINFVAYQIYVKAIRLSPLSLTIPFLAFTPIFMPLTSWLILGAAEVPGPQGLAGIVLVVAGAYLLHAGKVRGAGLLAPLRAIARERGSLLMLGVAFVWSFTANLDKMGIVASSRDLYFLAVHAVMVAAFGATLALSPERSGNWRNVRASFAPLAVLGLLAAATLIFQGTALVRTRAPYVIAVKRSGLLLSVLIGCLYFREGALRDRLLGGAVMAAGAALVLTST